MTEVEKALLAVVNAMRDYLPPNSGITPQECLNRIFEAIDNPVIGPFIAKLEGWEYRPASKDGQHD